MLGRCRRLLGEHEAALADLDHGAALALETGRENVRLQLAVERVTVLIELGRLAEARAAAEQGVELARLVVNPPMLLWARCARSAARLAAGDVTAALEAAREAADSGVRADFHAAGQPDWALGNALVGGRGGGAGSGRAARGGGAARLTVRRSRRDLAEARGVVAAALAARPGPFAAARARLAEDVLSLPPATATSPSTR